VNVRGVALSGMLVGLLPACSHDFQLHLVAQETAASADIRIQGERGTASWNWGSNEVKQAVTSVEEMRATQSGGAAKGPLRVTLADGSVLTFVEHESFYICQSGCDGEHLPTAWARAPTD
jgi:hypothetical protein